jgi:hypothetical protein
MPLPEPMPAPPPKVPPIVELYEYQSSVTGGYLQVSFPAPNGKVIHAEADDMILVLEMIIKRLRKFTI